MPSSVEKAIEQAMRRPNPRKPEGWPDALICPGCRRNQPITAYKIVSKVHTEPGMLNIVVVCRQTDCRHIFSPGPAMLAQMQLGVDPEQENAHAASPRSDNGRR